MSLFLAVSFSHCVGCEQADMAGHAGVCLCTPDSQLHAPRARNMLLCRAPLFADCAHWHADNAPAPAPDLGAEKSAAAPAQQLNNLGPVPALAVSYEVIDIQEPVRVPLA